MECASLWSYLTCRSSKTLTTAGFPERRLDRGAISFFASRPGRKLQKAVAGCGCGNRLAISKPGVVPGVICRPVRCYCPLTGVVGRLRSWPAQPKPSVPVCLPAQRFILCYGTQPHRANRDDGGRVHHLVRSSRLTAAAKVSPKVRTVSAPIELSGLVSQHYAWPNNAVCTDQRLGRRL
jgi:hypothetical protein